MKLLREIFSLAIMASALLISGCDNTDNESNNKKELNKGVTYYTINGAWQLTEWNDAPLAADTHLYILLDRTNQHFEMWDNFDSMYSTMRSGSFTLTTDELGRSVISGWYDYGVGDWTNDYIVELNAERDNMLWSSVSGNETMQFVKIDKIPDNSDNTIN